MGGRGSSSGIDTSYQGNRGYARASSSGYSVSDMKSKLASVPQKTKDGAPQAVATINRVANNPNEKITIYRATVGDRINNGDWVFLDKSQAERWTKTPFGRQKPGVKVVTMSVKASDVDWTGKNLEFMLNKKKKRK